MDGKRFKIVVCRGPECGEKRSSRGVYDAVAAAVAARGLEQSVKLDWQKARAWLHRELTDA